MHAPAPAQFDERQQVSQMAMDASVRYQAEEMHRSPPRQRLVDDGRAATFDFIFIDADKQNYEHYYELSLQLLRDGGLIAVDNTLWSGDVADPANMEPGTRAIRRFNDRLRQDTRVEISLVPIGDGLTLVYKPAVLKQ